MFNELGEGSVVKKRIFFIFCSFFWPKISYLDPRSTPDRTAEKKHEVNALIYNSDTRVIIIDPRAFLSGGSFRIWISVFGPFISTGKVEKDEAPFGVHRGNIRGRVSDLLR